MIGILGFKFGSKRNPAQISSIESADEIQKSKYDKMITTLGMEVIIAIVFCVIFMFVVPDGHKPFWKKDANLILKYEAGILFVFFVLLIVDRKFYENHFFKKQAWNLFYIIGGVQIIMLSFLIEGTYGLMLSPFSEFYALIFLTVLILSKSATRAVWIFTPITFYCVIRNLALDLIIHGESTTINTSWHFIHGAIFISILGILFMLDRRPKHNVFKL